MCSRGPNKGCVTHGHPAPLGAVLGRRMCEPHRVPGPTSVGAGLADPIIWAPVFAMRVLDAPETVCDFGRFVDGDTEARVSGLRRRGCRLSRGSEVGRRGCRPSREAGGCCPLARGLAIPETRGLVPCEAAAGGI